MVSNNEHNEEAEMNREDGGIAGLGMHPLPVARLGGMRREYFERMTDIGTASAAARWIADLLPPWLTWLREPEMKPQDLDDEVQLMLVTGFNISLAVRDAIIMTVVADESQWDEGVISRFAAHPHDKDVAQSMSAMLTAAFEEPESDERRCVRVVELLHTMSGRLPAECTRQLRGGPILNGGVATSPRCTMRSGCSRRMNGSHWRLSSRLRSPDTSTRHMQAAPRRRTHRLQAPEGLWE